MSRNDYNAAAQTALDRFETPAISPGFADRVVAAALASGAALPPPGQRSPPRRDRRGLWRRAGQAAIGVAVFGTMSAAAVASGLLGAVGIDVPVLTAMLAPAPVKKPTAVKVPQVKLAQRAEPEPVAEPPPPVEQTVPKPPTAKELIEARRAVRRALFLAEREAFLKQYPGLREAIAAGPEARQAYMAQHPEARTAVRARIAEIQARRAAGRAAMIQRQRARLDDPVPGPAIETLDPVMRAAMAERLAARRAEWDALDPAERTARIEAFKARQAERRARRLERLGAQESPEAVVTGEGSAPPAR
jgi:hypothetical protein